MPNVVPFEVISQPIAPGVPDIPYVQQGAFLQLTNVGEQVVNVQVNYAATPAFVESSGAVILLTNYIDSNGTINQIAPSFFLEPTVGFGAIDIPGGATYLFGVQYIINPAGAVMVGGTPQDSAGTRGIVSLIAPAGSQLVALATIRQVFNNYNASGTLLDVTESAYAVPIIGGPLISF